MGTEQERRRGMKMKCEAIDEKVEKKRVNREQEEQEEKELGMGEE